MERRSLNFVNSKTMLLPALVLGLASLAGAQSSAPPTKVGIIQIQGAILGTKDGQKALNNLQAKFAPKKTEIEKKQNEIAQLQDQMRKGSNTMSDEAKQKLARDIDQKTKILQRDTEDAQAELDQEQNRIMQELGAKIMAVISKYAQDNGYAVILDVSSPQTPVLYAANGIDITQDIVKLYDENAPAASGTAAPPPAAARPAAPKPAAPKPAVPAPKK
ncbi:MAG: OmpH family outer membrane protein [Bryobacterales bacterium]|nr:OmpH family outer membrane protein [Bryobacterales bacterium]